MGKCMFAYPDFTLGSLVYTSVLSGGLWNSSFPLTNLKNRLRSKVARSANMSVGSTTFNIDLGAARASRIVALLNHNATVDGTIRVQFYTDSEYNTLVGDTGAVAIIGDDEVTTETLYNWRPDWWISLTANVTARYVKVSISDTTNPAGYFELGRFCVMGSWSPSTVNISYGQTLMYDHSSTKVEKSLGGTKFFDRRSSMRISSVSFDSMVSGDAHAAWLEMHRRLGIDKELFLIKDPDETDFYKKQQSFLGTISQQSALTDAYLDNFTAGLTVEESVG